jgi:hypothetical protein
MLQWKTSLFIHGAPYFIEQESHFTFFNYKYDNYILSIQLPLFYIQFEYN